jgi:hypothetical protein
MLREVLLLALLAGVVVAIPAGTAVAKGDKARVCHVNDEGEMSAISVSLKAEPVHLAHGDFVVGGDDFDADRVPVPPPTTTSCITQ